MDSYSAAVDYCSGLGAHVLLPAEPAENDCAGCILSSIPAWIETRWNTTSASYEGPFGQLTYSRWKGEPVIPPPEDTYCVVVVYPGEWLQFACSAKLVSLCQKDACCPNQ